MNRLRSAPCPAARTSRLRWPPATRSGCSGRPRPIRPRSTPHALPTEVDVAVVGAGYCGLAAARELARTGRSVVVVERDPIGVGASTRNGGMVIPELKAGPAALEKKYGPVGRRLYDRGQRGVRPRRGAHRPTRASTATTPAAGQLYLAHNQAARGRAAGDGRRARRRAGRARPLGPARRAGRRDRVDRVPRRRRARTHGRPAPGPVPRRAGPPGARGRRRRARPHDRDRPRAPVAAPADGGFRRRSTDQTGVGSTPST